MDWPLPSNYAGMLQSPELAFKDPELKKCRIKRDSKNQPLGFPGQFAIVYKAELPGGAYRAIRAFIRKVDEPKHRYSQISDHLGKVKVGCLVGFKFEEKGIRSDDGRYYPLVTMDWVSGTTLFEWLRIACRKKDRAAIRRIADRWVEVLEELGRAKIAHGDLQHANVMVTDKEELRLVDYDCMCVPSLVGRKNMELGVLPYQHPQRDEDTLLSLEIDNFSALVIFVGLRALAAGPELWEEFVEKSNHDKILFRTEDFKEPAKSPLIARLRKSPDADVVKVLEEVLRLYRGKIGDVPRLEPILFSFDEVRGLLKQKKFDEALEIVRKRPAKIVVPPDLTGPIRNAEERVECRKRLEEKAAAGDENGLIRLYQPTLLDDYPAAKPAVDLAKQASAALKALQPLQAAHQSDDVREFVRLWQTHRALLQPRKSAARFVQDFPRFERRNQLAEAIVRQLNASQRDAAALAKDWQELQSLGGHKETNSRAAEVDAAIARGSAWDAFVAVASGGRPAGEDRDQQLLAAWNEDLFKGWSAADVHRPAIVAAKKQLQLLKRLEQLAGAANAHPTADAEQQLATEAAALPPAYAYRLQDRVRAGQLKLQALGQLQAVLQRNGTEEELVAAGDALNRADAAALATGADVQRVELARRRTPLLQRLARLTKQTPLPELDQALLSIWNSALLDSAPEAAPWKAAYQAAEQRRTLLGQLDDLLRTQSRDDLKAAELAANPLLRHYPLPPKIEDAVRASRKNLQAIDLLLEALQGDNPQAIAKAYDRKIVERFAQKLAPAADRLARFVREHLRDPAVLGLGKPVGRLPLQATPATVQLRWSWPDPRYCEMCLVTLTREKPENEAAVQRAAQKYTVNQSVMEAGNGLIFPNDPRWKGYFVAVWAQIPSGAETILSRPLVLGRLEAREAGPQKKSWGDTLFGEM